MRNIISAYYLMLFYSSLYSFSRNSIYSIHYTYYSLAVSGLLSTFFMIVFLFLCECFMFSSKYNLVVFSLLCFVLNFDSSFFGFLFFILMLYLVYFFLSLGILYSFSLLSLFMFLFFVPLRYAVLWFMFFIFIFFLFMWINDIITECSFVFTSTEQFSLIYGIKLLILSEFMLFFCLFWTEINFRFILSVFSCFYALPLLSSFCFAIPYTNVIVLLFSSLPIQATIIFYKVGLFYSCIEQLGQTVSCGTVFLVLQLKEFFYSFHSITDCMIGSIFYFTTGLHGFHVLAGLFYFYLILCVYFFGLLFNISFFASSSLISAYYSKKCATLIWALLCSIYLLFLFLFKYIKYSVYISECESLNYVLFIYLLNYLAHLATILMHCLLNRGTLLIVFWMFSAALYSYLIHLFQTKNNNKYAYFYIIFYYLVSSSYYRCFVDLIWLVVFILYFSIYALTAINLVFFLMFSAALYCYTLLLISKTKNNNKYAYFYIEFNESLFYSSYYWHFVDLIWLIVFILYFF